MATWRKVHINKEAWEWTCSKYTVVIKSPAGIVSHMSNERIDYDEITPGRVKNYIKKNIDILTNGRPKNKKIKSKTAQSAVSISDDMNLKLNRFIGSYMDGVNVFSVELEGDTIQVVVQGLNTNIPEEFEGSKVVVRQGDKPYYL